jgi:L-aminopeptidase/D-esterase-like protein
MDTNQNAHALQSISIADIAEVRIGHDTDNIGKTGVTVLYFPNGAMVGSDISGGGPASRETPLTMPDTAANPLNAIVLGGGSAFGLAASDGVLRCLSDSGIGYDTGYARVPLVCQSDIYDLCYGSPTARPNADMGYRACQNALTRTDDAAGTGGIKADINLVGMLSAEVMAAAIGNAIETSRISEEEFMANIVRL